MKTIQGEFRVPFRYEVHFTEGLFEPGNGLLREVLTEKTEGTKGTEKTQKATRALVVVDGGVDEHTGIAGAVEEYFFHHRETLHLVAPPLVIPGGEAVKNDPEHVVTIRQAVSDTGLDRHSYIIVVGGGALLDVAGFAAATAHRGIRLLRVPTTTLSQNDSGVGVKNGINDFGKKNFTGTFAPAWAVLNDFRLLDSLPMREWRNGIAEAVKVALIKDPAFFEELEEMTPALAERDGAAMRRLIHRCAELHVLHICSGGDPFEMGSSRPLDFGHWSAHKLEQLTNFELRHGEAVAIGIALDVTYSHLQGWISEGDWQRALGVLSGVGFALYAPELERYAHDPEHPGNLFRGLREFREHLGGQLTIQMLRSLGEGFNVHEIDEELMARAIALLRQVAEEPAPRGAVERREAVLA